MSLREIRVAWVPKGLAPLTSYPGGQSFGADIGAALRHALAPPPTWAAGCDPWLRAGTGHGAEVVNVQGIRMLAHAFNAGVNAMGAAHPPPQPTQRLIPIP